MSSGVHARREDTSFTDVKIKPQIEMRPGGVNDVTHLKLGLRILGIWEKQRVEIRTWAGTDDFVRYGRRALIGLRADDVKAVSIERLCVSLSSCRKTFKLKKMNKNFLPEPISRFRIPIYVYENYVYFTHPYHGYVTICQKWIEIIFLSIVQKTALI